MKRFCVAGVSLLALVMGARADLITWGYSGDLGVGYDGYFVQLFEDVDKDSNWPVLGYTLDGDDAPVAGVTATISNLKGLYYWGSSFSSPGGSLTTNDYVFTVIYDGPTAAGPNYRIVDPATGPYHLPYPEGPGDLTYGGLGPGGWQPVPEPATLALLGLGAATIFAGRRRFAKKS